MDKGHYNLVLEHLRALRADTTDIREILQEHGRRLTQMEGGLAILYREHTAAVAEGISNIEGRSNNLNSVRQPTGKLPRNIRPRAEIQMDAEAP